MAINKRIPRVILVDDDESTNFLNRIIIRQAEITEHILAFDAGDKALGYLTSREEEDPSLLLVDLNMPLMNGWEFIHAYAQLPEANRKNKVLVILTSSVNPEDQERAADINVVSDFVSKPLTHEVLKDIMVRFF